MVSYHKMSTKRFCNVPITKSIQHGIVMVVKANTSVTGTMGTQLLRVYLQNYGRYRQIKIKKFAYLMKYFSVIITEIDLRLR